MVARSKRKGRSQGSSIAAGAALLFFAVCAMIGLAFFYFSSPTKPVLDHVSLCPVDGARGVAVVLVDTSDDLKKTTQQELLNILQDQISNLPEYYKLDLRVLDIERGQSRSLFSKCNPGDGSNLSEWTANPRIAKKQWIEEFMKPARDAMKTSMGSAKAHTSPIMAAIQNIALGPFSELRAAVPKSLMVVSDMLEYTPDYSQYPSAGDLSYDRFRQSRAYRKYWTDLRGARVTIEYVSREQPKIDTVAHMQFWRAWVDDNKGKLEAIHRLQGAN